MLAAKKKPGGEVGKTMRRAIRRPRTVSFEAFPQLRTRLVREKKNKGVGREARLKGGV